ncbi:MAG: DUF4190 domain-containing protein [Planctomycetaceae bacterium]|nr:DUF4190 domain-containing protein [Planctomycetales bacterium]MCB9927619.1 DUF4190 domain-containing protein [Planctomycetaceae bacterium]
MAKGPQNPFGENPYNYSPQWQPGAPPLPASQDQGDSTGGVIPYKNMPALLAYYLGLFSLLPCLGLFLAIPAFVLGIMGLKKRKQNPVVKGSVHAWIGIVMGGLMTLVWGIAWILFIVGLVADTNR